MEYVDFTTKTEEMLTYKAPRLTGLSCLGKVSAFNTFAEVAELVDALASGASELRLVEVQVLFSAPLSFQA